MRGVKNALRPYWYRLKNGWRHAKSSGRGLLFDLFNCEYRSDGMVFEVPREVTDLAFRSRFFSDSHERDEREGVRRHLPMDATVLELGAGLGVVSCLINSRMQDRKRHVAVEANPQLIETVRRNRDRNGLGFAIEHGVVAKSSNGTFFLAPSISNSSRVDRGRPGITVPTMTVADLEQKHDLRFDALVCDIEGGEAEFFADNPDFPARCRAIIIQFHPKMIGAEACDACRAMFGAAGLRQAGVFGSNEAWVRP
jgi:FkbM family methyltransferase